jgi:hypothetical protein
VGADAVEGVMRLVEVEVVDVLCNLCLGFGAFRERLDELR